MNPKNRFHGKALKQAVLHHRLGTPKPFLRRLEDEVDRAVEVSGLCEILCGSKHHGRVAVMPTGVHLAVVSGAMIKGVRFLNRQGVHVRSNPHRAGSGTGTQRAHNAGPPDAPVNLAAERLQPLRNEFRGALLLEAQFRMSVNVLPPLGQLPVVFGDCVD